MPMTQSALNHDTFVVIPLYNEATVIAEVIRELKQHFKHVICVDDGSTDASATLAKQAGAFVINHPINLGQGAALQTGFEFALQQNADYVITFDADGQHRVEDALRMLERARCENLAIVVGSRFLDTRTQPGALKKLVLKTAAFVTNLATSMKLTDAHNGLRLIRRDALKKIDLKQDRMAHGTEIIIQLGKCDLPWAEEPVEVLYTSYSKAKGQSLLNSVNILIDLVVR